MERTKMPREKRAAQFAPFDALKGLSEALRLVEYEHDRKAKGDISNDQAEKISNVMQHVENNSVIKMKYFNDGYEHIYEGKIKIDVYNQIVEIPNIKIKFDNIIDMDILENI